jgi:hypothetical protein
VIVDRVPNIGDLPDPTLPARTLDPVRQWLAAADDRDVTTPLSVLRPLVAKEGEHHSMNGPWRLTFQPFAVSPTWARPVRDVIRTTLREQACGTDAGRAAAAVDLLGEALRQPSGLFGRPVRNDEVLSWESDDLATLAVLQEAAETTISPVIRRSVRHEIVGRLSTPSPFRCGARPSRR